MARENYNEWLNARLIANGAPTNNLRSYPRLLIGLVQRHQRDIYASLLEEASRILRAAADVHEFDLHAWATEYVDSMGFTLRHYPRPVIPLLIANGSLAESQPGDFLRAITMYLNEGGTIIIIETMTYLPYNTQLDNVFAAIGLPWKVHERQWAEFDVNPAMIRFDPLHLTPHYYQEATLLNNVPYQDAVYILEDDPNGDSLHSHMRPPHTLTKAPIAFGKVGPGWFGYIGDRLITSETVNIIINLMRVEPEPSPYLGAVYNGFIVENGVNG